MDKDFKKKQQDLTELNSDGNRERGRNGEDLSSEIEITKEEEEQLKKKLEKLRQQDPFIYR
tara:strand:- start:278 stop:460 length:183 start_codon:yes stop_codon:yes gene_type:complete